MYMRISTYMYIYYTHTRKISGVTESAPGHMLAPLRKEPAIMSRRIAQIGTDAGLQNQCVI